MPGPGFSNKGSSGDKRVEAAKRQGRLDAIRLGYRRTDGFDPQRGDGRMSGMAKDEEVKRRAREGKVIDNSVFYK